MHADEDSVVAVSPRHSVRLSSEYVAFIRRAPRVDFVVRTIARREANGLPLMSAEFVIAGAATREKYPLAAKYPLHFKKTYFRGRLHGDPKDEFDRQSDASRIVGLPPPIGFDQSVFRACLLPGKPYSTLSPFQSEPAESNLRHARELPLAAAAGLWKLLEQAFEQLQALHRGGLCHGDTELHNFVVCSTPLEIIMIDFESASQRGALSDSEWQIRREKDQDPLLQHAIFLECSLGAQPGPLGELARSRVERFFRDPERIKRAIETRSELTDG